MWERQRFSSTALTNVKIVVLAPMPSDNDKSATAVKPGVRRERAERVARVLHDAFQEMQATCVAALLFPLIHAAELAQRGEARLLVRHSAGAQHFNLTIEVIAHLLVELGLDSRGAQQRLHAHTKHSK